MYSYGKRDFRVILVNDAFERVEGLGDFAWVHTILSHVFYHCDKHTVNNTNITVFRRHGPHRLINSQKLCKIKKNTINYCQSYNKLLSI